MSEHKDREITSIAVNLLILFASIYVVTSSGPGDYSIDAGRVRYEVTRSIVERADLAIPSGLGVKGSDGRDYSWFGLGQSLLAIPFYCAGKCAGSNPMLAVSMMNQFIGAATVVLVFLFSIALGYSKKASLLTSLFYGLGTMAWPYAKSACDHPAETFFVLLATYFMNRHTTEKTILHLCLSASSLGTAILIRPYSILALPPLFLMSITEPPQTGISSSTGKSSFKSVLPFFSAMAPFAAVALWYNHYRFGTSLETGYGLIAARTGLEFFTGTPLMTGLTGFLASPGKGYFFYSPVAVLFFFSIRQFSRRHPGLAACFILLLLSYLLFLSKNIYWHGDFAWGPRYLLVITPYLVLPVLELLDSPEWSGNKHLRKAMLSLFALSVSVQMVSVAVDGTRYFISLQEDKKVRFTQVKGVDVQPIREPPVEVYFNWRLSPIAAQFRYVYDAAFPPSQTVKSAPDMPRFDFWWLYQSPSNDGGFFGPIAAMLLFLLALSSALRIKKQCARLSDSLPQTESTDFRNDKTAQS